MKTLDEFKAYFDQDMMLDLEMLDNRRKAMLRRIAKVAVAAAVVLLVLVFVYLYFFSGPQTSNESTYFIIAGIIVLIGAFVAGFSWARDKTFYSDFKAKVIERIVKYISADLVYEPKNYVGSDSFERSCIFLNGIDRYTGDDMVRGKIDKTQIWFSEVKAEYKSESTDSKGNRKTTWHTIFKGLFFIADFNKHFSTSTVVLPNRLGKGFMANFFNKMNLARKEKHVRLEDPDFNKHFVVYGEDQIEARYVLSTSLMERITRFKEKHPAPVYLSFVNSFLYVAIAYNKNLFEPSYFKRMTDFNIVKDYFRDIELAVSIVNDLNLNTRIWTKE